MTAPDSQDGSSEYGPVEAYCPNCREEFPVEAGPTPRCEVVHEPCGEWLQVDLRTGGTCEPIFGEDTA